MLYFKAIINYAGNSFETVSFVKLTFSDFAKWYNLILNPYKVQTTVETLKTLDTEHAVYIYY